MPTNDTRQHERLSCGGYEQTLTKTYYIVWVCPPGKNNPKTDPVWFLKDEKRGLGKRRSWRLGTSDFGVYKFEKAADAKRAAQCARIKKFRETRDHYIVEIVEVREVEVKRKTYDVHNRPGVNPLVVLALEAE